MLGVANQTASSVGGDGSWLSLLTNCSKAREAVHRQMVTGKSNQE